MELIVEGSNLTIHHGKNGTRSTQTSISCCQSHEDALTQFETQKIKYIDKKYLEVSISNELESFNGVYDKAKWHYGGDFPKDLPDFQGCVHIGFFLSWLIENQLVDQKNKFINKGVNDVLNRKITGALFLRDYLDGSFTQEDLTRLGGKFTFEYYHKGLFTEDYLNALGQEFESLYYISDTWLNYDLIKPIIDKRYLNFKNRESTIFKKIKNLFLMK